MAVRCPICGGQTKLRTRSKDGKKFHVCIRCPECRGKIEYDEEWDNETLEDTHNNGIPCPDCGGNTVPRKRKGSNCTFHVCARYPKCKGYRVEDQKKVTNEQGSSTHTSGLAITALVLGVLGFSIIAIVFGALGMEDAKKPGVEGYGMAVAGLALGIIWLLLSILGVILAVVI